MNRTEELNTNLIPTINIHNFLKNGDEQIKYSPNKDIVLLLGNIGSGKTTLTQFISGNSHTLWSQEVEEDTGEYVIVDTLNKINSNSALVSHTIYPELVEDAKKKILYYDCPGFSNTMSTAHEIAATYFINKVIDSARSVKLVFVVSHHSVSRGADRQDLILMLQHATDFIRQIEKYKNSIALVVTKIENRYVGNKIVSDEKVIGTISHYIEQVIEDISMYPEIISSEGKEKVLSFLEIFLSKDNNDQLTKIGIFRKPSDSGLLIGIERMKESKTLLKKLIQKNTKSVNVDDKDFRYTVSAKSTFHIGCLAEEINKTIVKQLFNMWDEVENYCIAMEEKISDLEYLNFTFQNLQQSFSKIQENAMKNKITPEAFMSEIDVNLKKIEIFIPDEHIKKVLSDNDYINFLNAVSNQSIKSYKSSLLAAGLSKLTEYFSESHSFYHVLNEMYVRLMEFDIQKNRNNYNTIDLNELSDLFESSIFKVIETIFKEHNHFRKIKLDKPKFKLLNRVLDNTLKYEIEVSSSEIDRIVVKGMNLKLSDVSELLRNKDIKFLKVYALHKVFIDISLDLTGREIQMAIVAPVWEVVGSQSIILDGNPGIDHNPQKARNGMGYGENGLDGLPGEPGGPAGNFKGIGKHYINEKNLHISTNGGAGGRGQDGGDGSDGYDGDDCPDCWTKEYMLLTLVYNSIEYKYPGGKGGNGGDGGIGGYGGHKGSISIIKVGAESGVVYAKQTARDGLPGADGIGGSHGKGGQFFWLKIRNYLAFVHTAFFEPYDELAENGISGLTGKNQNGRKKACKLTKLLNFNNIKTEYKTYSLSNINNSLQEKFLMKFIDEMDNHTFITQPMKRKKK
ncbi:uncharacterized protein [Halyomorpha halys]|uniref:uncharacterized protein n=1 Tax=Halyomorpha halys TaxID=286706 RepID=UPI0006D4DE3D|nr:uncharacterized protein LOC106677066 [Halyomorpha halys]XP_014270240.1 uncharacterized protein LOC106677066 [Halyomorpha halys]